MKEYGTPDPDRVAYLAVLRHTVDMPVKYIVHHQRVPINARACQLPQSLLVQAVLVDGQVVTAFQPAPGHPARIQT